MIKKKYDKQVDIFGLKEIGIGGSGSSGGGVVGLHSTGPGIGPNSYNNPHPPQGLLATFMSAASSMEVNVKERMESWEEMQSIAS